MAIEELQHRASAFLMRRPIVREAAMRAGGPADGGAAARAVPTESQPPFQLFVPEQLKAAIDLAAHFMELANADDNDDRGLQAVLDEADKAAAERGLDHVKYALM